jgi:hypothetical protein
VQPKFGVDMGQAKKCGWEDIADAERGKLLLQHINYIIQDDSKALRSTQEQVIVLLHSTWIFVA